jgi:hypothetical protein
MPHLRLDVLVDYLNTIQIKLYDIYLECKNNELAERLLRERDYIVEIIEEVEELIDLQKRF